MGRRTVASVDAGNDARLLLDVLRHGGCCRWVSWRFERANTMILARLGCGRGALGRSASRKWARPATNIKVSARGTLTRANIMSSTDEHQNENQRLCDFHREGNVSLRLLELDLYCTSVQSRLMLVPASWRSACLLHFYVYIFASGFLLAARFLDASSTNPT